MALGTITVEVEGTQKTFIGFEIIRRLNAPAYAYIIFSDNISVSGGNEITIKENGTVKFGGFAREIKLTKDRKKKVRVEGYGSEIIDGKVSLTNSSDSPETILTSALSGTGYTLTNTTATGITITSYNVSDARSRVFRDMIERTGYITRWEANKHIYFETVGEQTSGYSYNTSTDNIQIVEWNKSNMERMANKVTVKGATDEGESYSETVSDATSISNYGEFYKLYTIDYLSNSTEASNTASKLLVTTPDEGGQIRLKPDSLDSYLNETISLTDSLWSISGSFVCYEQKIKYPQAVMLLQLGFPEAIASPENKRIYWLAQNSHDAELQEKKYLQKNGDTMYGDLSWNTSGLTISESDGSIGTALAPAGTIYASGVQLNASSSGPLTVAGSGNALFQVDINMDTAHKIINLADPTNAQDAATKNYVDTQIGGSGDVTGPSSSTDNAISRWDGTGGDVLQDSVVSIDDYGNLYPTTSGASLGQTGTSNTWNNIYLYSAAGDYAEINSPEGVEFNVGGTRYFYVDTDGATSGAFNCNNINPLSTSTINVTGNLDFGSTYTLNNLVNPTNDYDAATKKYVDDNAGGISGPSSSSDNAVARFDGTTGDAIQDSQVTIDDSGRIYPIAAMINGTNTSYNLYVNGLSYFVSGVSVASGINMLSSSITNASNISAASLDINGSGSETVYISGTLRVTSSTYLDGNTYLDGYIDFNNYDVNDCDDVQCNSLTANDNSYIKLYDDIDTDDEVIFSNSYNLYLNSFGSDPVVIGSSSYSGRNDDLIVEGDFDVYGTKNCIIKTEDGEELIFSAIESPEVWFEEKITSKLSNGKKEIVLDERFIKSITIDDENPLHVIATPLENCNGLWVEKKENSVIVHEINNGTSNAAFDIVISAKRKNKENIRFDKVVRDEDTQDKYKETYKEKYLIKKPYRIKLIEISKKIKQLKKDKIKNKEKLQELHNSKINILEEMGNELKQYNNLSKKNNM